MPDITLELEAPEGYNLQHTMSGSRLGAYDPATRIENGAGALAIPTPEGAVGLAATHANGWLRVEGWGEGASWLEPHVPALFGLDDDPGGFAPQAGPVRNLWRQFPGMHLPRFPTVFDRLVRVILLQLVTWNEACRTWGRLVRALGDDAPGPLGVRVPPSPEILRATPDYELIALGVRPKQARTIRRVASHAKRIDEVAAGGPESLATVLAAIPGIGPWTIGYIQGSALGFADAVLPGDYNLPHTVAYVLAGEPRASEERMFELLEPYRGHRFRVIRLLWMNGVSAPRRGPREG